LPPSVDGTAPPVRPLRVLAGGAVALLIAGLIASVFAALASTGGHSATGRPPDVIALVAMTATQAALTTVVSLAVGIALAWALNRLRFPGRDAIVALLASALVTPGLVVAFGLIAVWGRAGWINSAAQATVGTAIVPSIFGLFGIVFAHVVLDAAIAARVLVARLDAIPDTRLKMARSLGLGPGRRFAVLDLPAMVPSLPGLGALIFLLAFTSFPIVLMLGGGPANQTLEVAIYAAARLDFDLLAAVQLALVQVAICGLIAVLAARGATTVATGDMRQRHWPEAGLTHFAAIVVLAAAMVAFGLPLLAVLVNGIGPGVRELVQRPAFWNAAGFSVLIGAVSAALALAMALAIAGARAVLPHGVAHLAIGASAYVYLAVPAVVLSLGLFIAIRNLGIEPSLLAAPVVILANALLSLPFAVATLAPPLAAIARSRGRLIRSLGLGGGQQWWLVEWPLLGRDVGIVLAISFCFSLGDLGVIALFGTDDFATLPLLMYRALGAYRSNDAAAIAAIMLVVSLLTFFLLPRLVGRLADARP
jgi:thiamine transport system permease protein